MPGECGRLALRETLSFGFAGSMTPRCSRSGGSSPAAPAKAMQSISTLWARGSLRYGDAFDLALVAADQLGAAHRPGGRIGPEELAIDGVHVLVLEHRID